MEKEIECPFCQTKASCQYDGIEDTSFYMCPICGRYEVKLEDGVIPLDDNKTAAYLFYHRFGHNAYPTEYRYHTNRSKEWCDLYKTEFEKGHKENGRPVHMDKNIIEAWYPKTFAERVDYILLYINEHAQHIGKKIRFTYDELFSLTFVDRMELDTRPVSATSGKMIFREREECKSEMLYMLDSLKDSGYIIFNHESDGKENVAASIKLTPKGYSRVDELQKNTANGRNVLVAMKFGEETKNLREAIRKGISDAGYIAIFIDEVEHNDFITPELLKHIRDSKFVVVDLTHQNNGAYFEEGYAMGLGKPVIQLCKSDTTLHFDIAQKNTIIWASEDEIPERLKNRIKATID